jgi:hypothetical protein
MDIADLDDPVLRSPAVPGRQDLLRWVVAGVISAAALVGILSLIIAATLLFTLPLWIEIPLAVFLAGGAGLYAWTLASALRDTRS